MSPIFTHLMMFLFGIIVGAYGFFRLTPFFLKLMMKTALEKMPYSELHDGLSEEIEYMAFGDATMYPLHVSSAHVAALQKNDEERDAYLKLADDIWEKMDDKARKQFAKAHEQRQRL